MLTYNCAVIYLVFLYLGGYCDSAFKAIKGLKAVKQLVAECILNIIHQQLLGLTCQLLMRPWDRGLRWKTNIWISTNPLSLLRQGVWAEGYHTTFQRVYKSVQNTWWETSLVGQWVRLHAPSTEGLGSIPGRGTRSHMHAATKSLHAVNKSPHATTKKPTCHH